ncbi:MAG: hypothetical protein JJ900_04145 [Rhodospirillales bacterium]|nr:hypothetical protein [Rhodospirillales bacterium]MBO6786019.1 hypothetical protein [Rhodospirillales bacterium]
MIENKPFYLLVVFWGEQHRRLFLDLALSSLLADQNIPALNNSVRKNRLLIATTKEDWDALKGDPIFRKAERVITPEFIELLYQNDADNKMLKMSAGHKALTDRAFRDDAWGVHLCPDVIYSNGSMKSVRVQAELGAHVVLTAAVRFEYEGVIATLKSRGLEGMCPLSLSGREAVDIALKHPHGEFKAASWDSPFFWEFPVYTSWTVPGENGVVQHTYSWSPILLDYAALTDHSDDIFDKWTLDGDYVYQNFPELTSELHVVTDSDEVFLLPVTPAAEACPPQDPHWSKRLPGFRTWTRAHFINMVHNHDVMDPLKRRIFFKPVRWHAEPINRNWEAVEARVRHFLLKYIQSEEADQERRKDMLIENPAMTDEQATYNARIRHRIIGARLTLGWIMRMLPVWMVYALYYGPKYGLSLSRDYLRVIGLALSGDRTEWERIQKRIRWLIARAGL